MPLDKDSLPGPGRCKGPLFLVLTLVFIYLLLTINVVTTTDMFHESVGASVICFEETCLFSCYKKKCMAYVCYQTGKLDPT